MFQRGFSKVWILLLFFILLAGGVFLGREYLFNGERGAGHTDQVIISAGVVPHHLLAESIIEEFFAYIASKAEPDAIVLISPDHFNADDSDFIVEPLEYQVYVGSHSLDASGLTARFTVQ